MADSGDLLFQGISQGFQNYKQTRDAGLAANGQIESILSQGGPQGVMQLSENGQKLAQKFMDGSATLKDKMQLLGEANTTISMKQKAQEMAKTQAETQLAQGQAGYNQAQAGFMNSRIAALNGMMSGQPAGAPPNPSASSVSQYAQPVGGTGMQTPPTQTQVLMAPPTPITINDPRVQAIIPQATRQALVSGGNPDEVIQKQVDALNAQQTSAYQAKAQAKAPTGKFYNLGPVYKDGVLQGSDWRAQMGTGAGTSGQSFEPDKNQIVVPIGGQPPGPMVDMAGNPIGQPSVGPGVNTNDPDWQTGVKEAYDMAGSSAVNLGNAKMLRDAAQAYTSGTPAQFNAIRGDPIFSKAFSMFSGTNPAAAFKMALAANTQSVLNEIRGPNGSVGGRILQNEYNNTQKVLPDLTADNDAIMAAANNNYVLADRHYNIDRFYAELRKTTPEGTARAMAVEHFGLAAPDMQTGMATPGKVAAVVAAPAPTGMVRMTNPQGQSRLVPKQNSQAAIAAGWKPSQ